MDLVPRLPVGLTARPLTMVDARAVYAVLAADEYDQLGKVQVDLEDVVSGWQRPSFDIEASTIGVFEVEALIAYAEHTGQDRGEVVVLPTQRGRGLGTLLSTWLQDLARSRGATVVGMTVPHGGPAERALADLGHRLRWTTWVLALPPDQAVPERTLPDGYEVREATADEYVQAHSVIDEAFLEWSGRDPVSYADFLAETVHRPGFEPWMLRVVTDADDKVAAAAYLVLSSGEAFIPKLATRAEQRHRGLAQALLADTFGVGRAHGASICSLSTDSRTGALGLYEKVGMVVVDTWANWAIDL